MFKGMGVPWHRALAELAVIVVGILMAFWVDALIQYRSDRNTEIRYLESLSVDLQSDIAELDSAAVWTFRHGHAAEQVLVFLEGDETRPPPDTLIKHISLAGWQYPPPFATLTLDELRSTGNLQLIRNGALKRAIGAYYDLIEIQLAINQPLQDRVWEDYDRRVKYLLSADARSLVTEEMYGSISGFDGSLVSLPDTAEIRRKLASIPDIKETLNEVLYASRVQRSLWADISRVSNSLLTDIHRELGR
jgi:hypothetical protein